MLPLPPVTLAPWELPSDCEAPLTAPADFVFQTYWRTAFVDRPFQTEIWARVVPYRNNTRLFFFCDGQRPYNGNWVIHVIEEEYEGFVNSGFGFDWIFDTQNTAWSNAVSRQFYFEGTDYGFPGEHCVKIFPDGSCRLRAQVPLQKFKVDAGCTSPFLAPNSGLYESADMMKEEVFALLNDADSELRFTLSWCHLTPAEQQEKALCFERSSLSEMQSLMTAVLYSQSPLWQEAEPLRWEIRDWQDNPYFSTPRKNKLLPTRIPSFPLPGHPHPTPPAEAFEYLHRWKHLLWDYFGPSFNEPLFDSVQCVRDCADDLATITAIASPPTAHEQLEARLLLRDWWQQKLTPLFFGNDTTQPRL